MRILHVIPNIERGGAERVMIMLARGAMLRGHQVGIVVLGTENAYADEIPKSVAVEMLGYSLCYRKLCDTLRCLRRLRSIIHRFQPDLVHSHLWPAARLVGWVRGHNSVRHLVHIHAPVGWLEKSDLRSRTMRLATRSALITARTFFVATGKSVLDHARRCLPWIPQESPVIHNGFDEEVFSAFRELPPPTLKGRLTIGMAARLVSGKGIDRGLKAIKTANLSEPWVCIVAGQGSDKPALERMARELGIADNVEFIGSVCDMGSFYRKLDVFVQPSLSEGLSLATLEAMACGLPVIATDVGATREVIRDGVEGLLAAPDDIPALSAAIRELAKNVGRRQTMGIAAHRRVWNEFSSGCMMDKVANLYARLIAPAQCS